MTGGTSRTPSHPTEAARGDLVPTPSAMSKVEGTYDSAISPAYHSRSVVLVGRSRAASAPACAPRFRTPVVGATVEGAVRKLVSFAVTVASSAHALDASAIETATQIVSATASFLSLTI